MSDVELLLTRRIQPAGGPACYEMRTGGRARDGHRHMVCRDCGAIADVNRVVGAQPCLDPGPQATFQVDDVEITFWGRCPDCQKRNRRRK